MINDKHLFFCYEDQNKKQKQTIQFTVVCGSGDVSKAEKLLCQIYYSNVSLKIKKKTIPHTKKCFYFSLYNLSMQNTTHIFLHQP